MDPEGDTQALMSSSCDKNLESTRYVEPIQRESLPLIIWTAVPYSVTSARSNDCFEELHPSEDGNTIRPVYREVASFSLGKYQTFGFLAGVVIGSYIQLSSLGANYLLTELYNDDEKTGYDIDTHNDHERTAHVLAFSLLWSMLTSLMGVMVLLILRSLVTMAATGNGFRSSTCIAPTKAILMLNLETYFAVGTLVGVCLSWTCTDVWIGLRAHSLQSLTTLVAALVWCKLVGRCCFSSEEADPMMTRRLEDIDERDTADEADDLGLSQPLLVNSDDDYQEHVDEDDCTDALPHLLDLNLFKYESIVLGILVGFFIQFSSLGANFLLSDFKAHESATYLLLWTVDIPDDHKSALIFSLLWSAVTSGMGILILLIARSLVKLTYMGANAQKNESASALLQDALLQLEGGFAVGALVGVNVSWVMTDLILDLQVQYLHSVLTLALSLVWCRSVSSCLIRSKVYQDEEDADEYDVTVDDERLQLENA
jgi:hypothetical protein